MGEAPRQLEFPFRSMFGSSSRIHISQRSWEAIAMKWEYHVFTVEQSGWIATGKVDTAALAERLNALGREGWELVSAFDTQSAGATRLCVFTLKRQAAH